MIPDIIVLIIFFFSVVLHEYAHGWVAYRCGDYTAKYAGRLTLNPLVHIDPIGTIALPLMLRLMHSPVIFGWAKPVPVNFWNLRNPKRDMIWVGLSGPAANFTIAAGLSLLLKFQIPPVLFQIVSLAVILNLVLMVFNLIPVPPLDGSRIITGLLPYEYAARYNSIEPFGFIIIIALLYLGGFSRIIWPVVSVFARLLGTGL